jgi:carbonic anhydrase
MEIKQIFKNNKDWSQEQLKQDKDYFKKLSLGQDPDYLYIGCSDSRVTAEAMMGVKPGEVFVHRNIANMVPNIDFNVKSVLTYAVRVLKVKHIIVCGHYQCGGVKAAMEHSDLGVLNPWLRNIRDVYRLHRKELNEIKDTNHRYDRLVELNVQEQCVNIIKTASVQKAIKKNVLRVHGWVFDINTGELVDLKIDFQKILKNIMEIYRLE